MFSLLLSVVAKICSINLEPPSVPLWTEEELESFVTLWLVIFSAWIKTAMFLLYHSEGCNICELVLYECYVNNLYTTTCSGMLGHHIHPHHVNPDRSFWWCGRLSIVRFPDPLIVAVGSASARCSRGPRRPFSGGRCESPLILPLPLMCGPAFTGSCLSETKATWRSGAGRTARALRLFRELITLEVLQLAHDVIV
jgi:hypothetical protein